MSSESDREQETNTPERPHLPDIPEEELQLVEVRENPEWWRGGPGPHGEVH